MKSYACRDGIDIAVAFATVVQPEKGTRSDVGSSPATEQVVPESADQLAGLVQSRSKSVQSSSARRPSLVRRLLKKMLRAPVKILYRLFKPFIRPIAFRLRAHFLDAMRAEVDDMRQDIVHIRAETVELREHMQLATDEQRAAKIEWQRFADGLAQELRATANSSQREMLAQLLPALGVLQDSMQLLTAGTGALARAAAAPIHLPQLDRIERLTLEEAKARAETAIAQSQMLDRIEQLALEEAKVRAEVMPAQSLKLEQVEKLALKEAKARVETAVTQSQMLDRIEQLALEEAKVRAAVMPAQSLKLDQVEKLALKEAKAREETAITQLQMLDRIEQYALLAARRFAVNCGGEDVMVRTEVGFVLCSGADQALLAILIDSGELEPGTRRVIQRILKPGDVFVDVGANVGLHTLAAAQAMEGRGKIIAFEPFIGTVRLLEASVWLNGFSSIAEIHQAAVSTASGTQSLYLGQTSGHHSLFPPHSAATALAKKVEVPLMKIDDVVGENQPVTLIKIDVEGAELQVLETARQTILRNPAIAIIAEFGPSHLQRTGHTPSEWIGAFANLGLDYRAINEQTGVIEIWSTDQLEAVASINLLFARAGSPLLLT